MPDSNKPELNNANSTVTTMPENVQFMYGSVTGGPMDGEPMICLIIKRFEQLDLIWSMNKKTAKAVEDALRHFCHLKH